MKLINSLSILTLLLPLCGYANEGKVIKSVKVCPIDQSLLKSSTVTVIENEDNKMIRFDVESGPMGIKMGRPTTGSLSYPVLDVKDIFFSIGGIEVTYKGHDSAGDTVERIKIYRDSTDDFDNGTMKSSDCK